VKIKLVAPVPQKNAEENVCKNAKEKFSKSNPEIDLKGNAS
jgi:hypothetical protein